MAPCKPAKSIKVRVPRQNAQRLGPSLNSKVHSVARSERTLVQLPPPIQEHPSASSSSAENASDWNSLLLIARAQRGPFWDVSTQQFLVDKESDLYYDATPLLEATRSLQANKSSQSQSHNQLHNPNSSTIHMSGSVQQRQQQHPQQHHPSQQQQQQHQAEQQRQAFPAQPYPYANNTGTPMMSHAGTPTRPGPGIPPYSNVHGGPQIQGMQGIPGMQGMPGMQGQNQFFGDMGTPTRPGGMMNGVPGAPGAGMTPDMYGRRITRGMSDGFPGYAG